MKQSINRLLLFAENQRLETERLILRPVKLSDAQDMYEYSSDEETTIYVFTTHQSLEETKATIAGYFLAAPLGKYGIELKETKKLIGTIDLRVDDVHANGEIGYTLNRSYWGKGYMPEVAEELLRFGFEDLQLVRIYAVHDVENPKSGRVMRKIGMLKEGISKNARISKGKIVTEALYGITIADWEKQKNVKRRGNSC